MLPETNVEWPPKEFKPFFEQADLYDGWYAGDVERLSSTYRHTPITHRAQLNGGIVGAATRAWLGKPQASGETRSRLHIPLAADIATLSADYLFGEAPRVVFPGERSENGDSDRDLLQERTEEVINTPRFHSLLLEAGEVASALGGVYLRHVWDPSRLRTVRAELVHADAAVPKFRYGDLESVTFWSELPMLEDDAMVYRHLEEHRFGAIEHGLFAGTKDRLGQRIDVERRKETAWLARPGVLNENSEIITGVDGLTAAYVPNMRPNAQFRRMPGLSMLGQSDFAQIVQLFDAVDEVWSSWMRDIRIAKARIVVAKAYLESNGFGQAASFDYDREVYEGMNTLTDPSGNGFGFHAHQFQIRVEEHSRSIRELREQAMRSAGWTPASAGGQGTGIRTATEIQADERLSERTRDKKSNYWKTLSPFFLTWMQLDALLYDGIVPEDEPEFRFPAESQVDLEKMARTTSLMRSADAISVETSVRMHHPDWDGDTVNTEVGRIYREKGYAAAADPTKVTGLPGSEPSPEDIAAMRERMERERREAQAEQG